MELKIVDNGFSRDGRAMRSLYLDGYEYILIEPKESTRDKYYPNFQNTGMALCGVRRVCDVEGFELIE